MTALAHTTHVSFGALGLPPTARCAVRDLWEHNDLGVFAAGFDVKLNGHCASMFRVVVVENGS